MCLQDEANELETELLQQLFSQLLLQAGQVYKQQQQAGLFEDDTAAEDLHAWEEAASGAEADSSEDEQSGGSDDGDEAEVAHQAAVKRNKQRRSWKPTKGELLMALLAMLLLGEMFVFLDMAGLFGRR
jgi:NACalpha-BTF3-like transcription factor